jgi:hypothetical protein
MKAATSSFVARVARAAAAEQPKDAKAWAAWQVRQQAAIRKTFTGR